MKTRTVYAVVFTPVLADHPVERECALFARRDIAEQMQDALVHRGACTVGKQTFNCRVSQGVFIKEMMVFG